LEECKRNVVTRSALSENQPSVPSIRVTHSKGPTYVLKLEMEHERIKTAYKTLSKERADWLITKEENEELRSQVQQLKNWRQRALTAENALEEIQNLADLNKSSTAEGTKLGSVISPNRVNYLERENQLLLAETGELRGRAFELQSKLEHALSQLQTMKGHRDKLLEHVRSGPSQGGVRWADTDLLTTPVQIYLKRDYKEDQYRVNRRSGERPKRKTDTVQVPPATVYPKTSFRHGHIQNRFRDLEKICNSSDKRHTSKTPFETTSDVTIVPHNTWQMIGRRQGLHEPQTTRILTLKANPSAEVKETLSNEVTRLRQENERFRQRIQVLEECTMRLRQRQAQSTHPLDSDEPTIGSVTMVVDQRLTEHPDPLTELEGD
uniref:CCDC92 domain-containing protein n=1 Tax=Echinostoma caproni TaxID=27848 RepID=A0A183B467_9TREM